MNVKAAWGYVFEFLLSQYGLYLYKNKNKRLKQMIYTKRKIQTLATNCLLSTFFLYIYPHPTRNGRSIFTAKAKFHCSIVTRWSCGYTEATFAYSAAGKFYTLHYIQERNCTKERKKDFRYNFSSFIFFCGFRHHHRVNSPHEGDLNMFELSVCSISIYNYK